MITNKAIPEDNFFEALLYLNDAQVSGDYIYEARRLAGPLITEVGCVFRLHKMIVYMVTCRKRRQVWNAWLSKVNVQDVARDPDAALQKLLHWQNKDLLEDAFGHVPVGFQGALERLGTIGHHPHIYAQLHQFMCKSAEHSKAFRHSSKITARTIEFMALMPDDLRSVRLAEKFTREKDLKALVFAVGMLAGDNPAKREQLCLKVKHAASHGGSIAKFLEKEYYETPFPAQVVPDGKHLRFINNAEELVRVSRHMKNCLAQYRPEAIRGEYQYYYWVVDGETAAAISMKLDHPFGWRIAEIQSPENLMVEDDLKAEIIRYFAQHGVFEMPDMESIIDGIRRTIKDDYDPVSAITELIDDMLIDDVAAA